MKCCRKRWRTVPQPIEWNMELGMPEAHMLQEQAENVSVSKH